MLPKVAETEFGQTRLARAHEFARSAKLQVFLGNAKAVGGLGHDLEAARTSCSTVTVGEEQAVRLPATAADAAAQLMQLGQSEPVGILDQHDGGLGDIHADLDHGGRHQQIDSAGLECRHQALLVGCLQTSVHQADAHVGQARGEEFRRLLGRLALRRLGFLDQGTDPVGLLPGAAGVAHPLHHLLAPLLADHHGLHRQAARWQFVDNGGVEIGIHRHGERTRDGRCRHHQLVRSQLAVTALVA